MSYANLVLYSSILPSYNDEKENKEDEIKADDPKNKGKVNKLLFG